MTTLRKTALVHSRNDAGSLITSTRRNQISTNQTAAESHYKSSMIDTPFHPHLEKHAAMLSKITGTDKSNNFLLQLQQTYGNQYVQRLISYEAVKHKSADSSNKLVVQSKDKLPVRPPRLPPEVLEEIRKQVAMRGDPRPIPEEAQVKEAKDQGEKHGKQLEKLSSSNKPLADLLLLDMMEKCVNESGPNKAPQPAESQGVKKVRQELKGKEIEENRQNRNSKIVKVVEYSAKGAAFIQWIPGVVNYFFSFLNMFTDVKAGRSAGNESSELSQVLKTAENNAVEEYGKADPQMKEVIGAIKLAVEQKNRKWWKRWISFWSTLASTGSSIALAFSGQSMGIAMVGALLASNPVGWGIAMALFALGTLGGLALGLYKLYRWWKKRESNILGKTREEIAATLFSALVVGKDKAAALSKEAIKKLGLSPDKMKKAYDENITPNRKKVVDTSVNLIKQKLKSL